MLTPDNPEWVVQTRSPLARKWHDCVRAGNEPSARAHLQQMRGAGGVGAVRLIKRTVQEQELED